MIRSILLLLALVSMGRPLAAQEPTPGQLQAAEHLVEVMQVERTWAPTQELTVRGLYGTAADTSRFAAESRARLREMFATRFSWEAVRPEYIRMYASLYTEDELRQLTAFYESPVGRKSLRIAPEFTARTLEMVRRLMAQDAP